MVDLTVDNELTFDDYVTMAINQRLINRDLSPIQCSCGCKDFIQFDEYWEDYYIVEYSLKCSNCNSIVGHFAYGQWEI